MPFCAVVFCAGIWLAAKTFLPFFCAGVVCFLALSGAVIWRGNNRVMIALFFLFVFAMGALRGVCARPGVLLGNQGRDAARLAGRVCTFWGKISSDPLIRNGRTGFVMDLSAYACPESARVSRGTVYMVVDGELPFEFGEEIAVRGALCSARGPAGRINRMPRMRVASSALVKKYGAGGSFSFKRLAFKLRSCLEGRIFAYMHGLPARIMAAMLFGKKYLIPPLVNSDMMKSGTVHILVISGFHVTLVACLVVFVLKLFRVGRRVRFCIALPCLAAYCLLTGGSAPVLRATVMSAVFLAAYPLRRDPDIHNAWALAALILLSLNPQELFNLGFQLSFVSVLAIIYVYPLLKRYTGFEKLKLRLIRPITEGFLVSLAAWAGTAGIIACACRMFSPVTVIANIVIVPLSSLITLAGFSLIAAAFLCPAAAPCCGRVCELLLLVLLKVNALFIKLPHAYFTW